MHFKATSQGSPLSDKSVHPKSVHSLWPLARFSAFNKRCSSNCLAIEAKLHFLEKLANSHPTHRAVSPLVDLLSDRRRVFDNSSSFKQGSWLVIPFHPKLHCINSVLGRARLWWTHSEFCRFAPRISWKLDDPSLASLVAADASRKFQAHQSR